MKFLPKKIIKTFLVFFAFCFFLLAFYKPTFAQPIPSDQAAQMDSWMRRMIDQGQIPWFTGGSQETFEGDVLDVPENEIQFERMKNLDIVYAARSLTMNLMGDIPAEGRQYRVRGAVPTAIDLMASLTGNPPVNTSEYIADLGNSLGLAKPAYAQGTGFSALQPVMRIWKAFRNISYMAFIILFIILGFAIMFRTKINPQTVISIQDALPRIIITLLLITFSYAIASLMIDLIYVAIYLAVAVFSSAGLFADKGTAALDRIFEMNVWQVVFRGRNVFISNPAKAVADIAFNLGGTWSQIIARIGGVQALVNVVLAVIIFFMMMKLFMSLLTSYVKIILSVVFAPFSLLLNVFPGSNSFTAWITGLLADVAVFPVVAIMFMLAAVLVGPGPEDAHSAIVGESNPWQVAPDVGYTRGGKIWTGEQEARGWTPPFLVGLYMGSTGGMSTADVVLALIGVGIILLTPHTVDLVKKKLKVEPSPLAGILGAAPGAVMGAPGRMAQTGLGLATQMHYLRTEVGMMTQTLKEGAGSLKARAAQMIGRPGEST